MNLYNTLEKKVEKFIPNNENEITLYTCGPTVYNYAHIGNLRMYISEDILEKSLNYLGYNVKRCMNITDVGHLESDSDAGEDKMLKGAIRENKTVWEIANFYTDAFFNDLKSLNIKKPEIIAKATDNIEEIIKIIKDLEQKGYTYFKNGNVYFDISKFKNYTALSRMKLEDLKIASREDVTADENKRNPQDFVLWFTKSKFDNHAMKWDSPWGVGYPGWHIECSAIAIKYLGEYLDIHCGGVDHIAIHHTNEIAQSESYLGHKWTNNWFHGEFLLDKTGKMSKSKGEFLTISLLEEKGYNPLVYRFFCLGSHYRNQLLFSYESLDSAANAYKKLKNKINNIVSEGTFDKDMFAFYDGLFKNALEDDLNTSNALTVIYDLLKDDTVNGETKLKLIGSWDSVLSLDLLKEEEILIKNDYIIKKIEDRNKAKLNKDYVLADSIREELLKEGIKIIDTKTGTDYEII